MGHPDVPVRDAGQAFQPPQPGTASVGVWRRAFAEPEGFVQRQLVAAYGNDPAVLARRGALWQATLERFAAVFGEEGAVSLIAVPSRINWEGHHVDHQGGSYNATTDEREVVAVARARGDATVRVDNIAAQRFVPQTFSLDTPGPLGKPAAWHNFVKGALLALDQRFPGRGPRGLDLVIGSDIPVGAGLSSSHALVLVSALAGLATRGLTLDKRDAVRLVRDGEWFVGSRTGLGDQATMIFGRRGCLFCSPVIEPDEIAPRYVALPADHACILISSFTHHRLAGDGLAYNARVFAYKTAFPLVLDALLASGAERAAVRETRHLADIHPDRYPQASIYRALAALPESMTLNEAGWVFDSANERLGAAGAHPPRLAFDELVSTYFGAGPRPAALTVKGVALYGLAECWRSRRYADLIEAGEVERAGALVYRGHDGDRVVGRNGSGAYTPTQQGVTDERLLALAADVEGADVTRREAAGLEWQTGEYRASVPELDVLVDLCRDSGAAGASLTGGGLGGVVTAMIRADRLDDLRFRVERYYVESEGEELRQVEEAARAGALPLSAVGAAQALCTAKRAAWATGRPFEADPDLLAELKPARALRNTAGDALIRLLPEDYHHAGIVLNRSVAGAGYLRPLA